MILIIVFCFFLYMIAINIDLNAAQHISDPHNIYYNVFVYFGYMCMGF